MKASSLSFCHQSFLVIDVYLQDDGRWKLAQLTFFEPGAAAQAEPIF